MANTVVNQKLSLRLLIDKGKNKVVLAEAGKDFVDVLFSLLTLPMGTIVRLLEKHQNPQSSIVGCFHNLYKSVSSMDIDSFETGSCKGLLLHPRSLYEIESHRRKIKLNIDDTETKFFVCPYIIFDNCCKVYSNLSTTRCSICARLMTREIEIEEEESDEVSFSCGNSFIITNDLKVALNSTGHVLNVLYELGYDGFEKLQEMLVDVGFQEVVTLLGCLFTSDAPLTDTFLSKGCMTWKRKMWKPLVQSKCREDFVDFLFTFLAIPLQFAWELSIDSANKGCIGNLCRSLNVLRFEQNGKSLVYKCRLPYYYNIQSHLLDVVVEEAPEYELLVNYTNCTCGKLSKKIQKDVLSRGQSILKLKPVNSYVKGTSGSASMGFLKGQSSFIVSDDMVVTPIKTSSTISMLSMLNIRFSNIEEQVITIGKSEAISFLKASLTTTSALNNGLSDFLSKLKPTKTTPSVSKLIKTENTH